ncbi:cardiolipin synthase [Verrucomicrobiota bacterium]
MPFQLSLLSTSPAPIWQWLSLDVLLHITLFMLVCLHCLRTRREATSSLLWIFVAWSFPLIGPLLFLMIGINRVPRKGWHKQRSNQEFLAARQAREDEQLPMAYWRAVHESLATEPKEPFARELNRVMNNILPDYPLLGGNQIQPLVTGDEAFPRMLEAIGRAQHHIHFQTFIIRDDAVGREFLDLLVQKAREGVAVRFMFDRFGSTGAMLGRLFSKYKNIPNMQFSGWTQVNALKRTFQINLRNHRKVLVIDGHEAFTGGINLHVENVSRAEGLPIRDYHFSVRGPIVQELQYSFLRDWYFMTNDDPEILLQQAHFPHIPATGTALVRVANGGPTSEETDLMCDTFFECLVSAQRQIFAVTPYFVPTHDIFHAFRLAALRGVDVRLIVPQHNNHVYAGMAGRALYEDLLIAGVRIFERHPPFMHAKALVIDDTLALVGSANLDVRSLRLNYETNLIVFDDTFVSSLKQIVLQDIADSNELNMAEWQRRPTSRQMLENFCNLLTPVL